MTTYFVSGHGNVTDEEFDAQYRPHLERAMADGASFVIGDFRGADTMAQELLHAARYEAVTVYHMLVAPRVNVGGWPTVGGFRSDGERDAAMTAASDGDIAWCRDPDRDSGTRRNLRRRG